MILRKLWVWEREQLRAHLLRLGPEDRRLRFCRPASDDLIHRYCDRAERRRATLIGCFAEGGLCGVAELVPIPEGVPAGAEIALSVEAPFQGQGIGTRLLQKALLLARNRFVDSVWLVALPENEPVRRLMHRFGAAIASHASDTEGRIRLPWPSCVSLLDEIAAEGQALIGGVFELPVDALAAPAPPR